MLKKIIFFICISFMLVGANDMEFKIQGKCVALKDFSAYQREVILYAYSYGRAYGFGYAMAAIAWKESCAGKYLINFADPSGGIYHAHIPGVIKQYTKDKDSMFLRNVVGQMLVSNPEFASSIALDHLKYWNKVRSGNFEKIIKSYNKGFSWEKNKNSNKLATNYYKDVAQKIKQLQNYIPLYIGSYIVKEPRLDANYNTKKDMIYTNDLVQDNANSNANRFNVYAPNAKSPEFYLMQER